MKTKKTIARAIVALVLCLSHALSGYSQKSSVSVNMLTGTANTVIPITSVTRGQVTLPVTLTYSGTGIKPKDVEGTAGIGWQVNAGGQISRKVRGIPDDVGGWLYNHADSLINNFTIHNTSSIDCVGQALDSAYIADNFPYYIDTEPDMFYISAPGLSFQMIFDAKHGKFQTIPYTDVKIDTTRYGQQLMSFTITNDQGIRYVFSQGIYNDEKTIPHGAFASGTYFQTQYQQYQGAYVHYFGSWMLTSMTDANNNGVQLHYTADTVTRTTTQMLKLYQASPVSGNLEYQQYAVERSVIQCLLDSITTTDDDIQNNILRFKWTANSYQGTNQSFIDNITGRGKNLKFNYINVTHNGASSDYHRYFLDSYEDVSTNSPVKYQFDYFDVSYSSPGGYKTILSDSAAYQHMDYWGYYTSNNTIDPNPSVYADPAFEPYYQRYEINPSNSIGSAYAYHLSGLEQVPDPVNIKAGSLRKITYAQGGNTQFEYECNDYVEVPVSSTTVNKGGGMRIKAIRDSDTVTGTVMTRNYSYINPSTGVSSGKPINLPVFAFATPYTGSATGTAYWNQSTMRSNLDLSEEDHTVMYEYAKVSQSGAGSTLYQYSIPQTNWDHVATKDYIAHYVCANYGVPVNDHDTYPFAPNPNFGWKQGMLLKATTFNEASTPQKTSETTYNYSYSAPDSLTAFKYDLNETNSTHLQMLAYAKYIIYYNTTALTSSVISKVYDTQGLAQAQTDTTTYTYDNTYHKLISQQTTNSNHSIVSTNYVYSKSFTGLAAGNTNSNINAIYQLQQLNINIPLESYTTVKHGSGSPSVIGASLTLYKDFPTGTHTMYLPSKQYKFVQPNGGGSFTPFSISGTTLTKDTRYILEGNYTEYDFTGVIQTADDAHKHTTAMLIDHLSYHPAIAIKNAAAYEIAFDDFDSDLIPAWTSTPTSFTGTAPAGSHTGKSHGMNSGGNFTYTIQKSALSANYIFSMWINSTAGGSFDFNLAPVSPSTGTTVNVTRMFAATGSTWKYYQWKLPMPVMSSGTTVKVTATLTSAANIGMDDLILYPESAEIATYAYNDTTYYKTAETNTNGISAYYINDIWGRMLYTFDQDKNIVARNKYIMPLPGVVPLAYTQQDVIKVAGITTDAAINALNNTGKQTTLVYADGFGRGLQTVGLKASPLQKDMVQPTAYNSLGQQLASWLPFTASDTTGAYHSSPFTEQAAFYRNTSQYLIPVDSMAYSQQVVEDSPLQRVLKAGMVGKGFQPAGAALPGGAGMQHYKTISYRSNNSSDATILRWDSDGSYQSAGYSNYVLAVTDGKDEDNIETLTYTDRAGHTILKRQVNGAGYLDTYYIYNEAGMVSWVVPPKAVAVMVAAGNYSLTQTNIKPLLFCYNYNSQGQTIRKKVPGKGAMSIIYDPLNRPVLTQDSLMAAAYKWNYMKYDVKGRIISQGIYTDGSHYSAAAMQSAVSGISGYATAWYERRDTTTATGYYTNAIFPTTNLTPLAYTYYDDYDLDNNGTANYSYSTRSLPNEAGATTTPIVGMPTIVRKSTVGTGMAAKWLSSVVFYDHYMRAIQTQSNNLLNHTANVVTDYSTTVLNFAGAATISQTVKVTGSGTGGTTTVLTTPAYDAQYRVTAITQRYNNGAPVTVAQYNYNELGQLINKGLGVGSSTANKTLSTGNSVASGAAVTQTATSKVTITPDFLAANGSVFTARIAPAFLQQVDFRFNIRGQLTNINNSRLTADGGATEQDNNSVFGMELLYSTTDANLGNTPVYNGKLSAVKWMSKDGSGSNSTERAFKYSYDAVDRYTSAAYAERTGSGSFTNTHGWDEAVTSYDANGNISHLNRKAAASPTAAGSLIDSLTYTYDSNNANQLYSVTDATGNNAGFGLYTGGSSGGHYAYDVNGNLVTDPYKNIALAYNVLNLTDRIDFAAVSGRKIEYVYDAGGSLIRKVATESTGGAVTTTDYISGFTYINTTLSYFPMPEGRVVNYSGKLMPEYTISDQQGNARVSFNNTGTGNGAKVIQENSFYGFGMVMPGSLVAAPATPDKKLYNGGSEMQNDFVDLPNYNQTFFRNYDAALGRWIGVDPDPESAESLTGYQYAGNNPIMFNDPLGNKVNADYTNSQDYSNHWYWGDKLWNEQVAQNEENFYRAIIESGGGGWFPNAVTNLYAAPNEATGRQGSGSLISALSHLSTFSGVRLYLETTKVLPTFDDKGQQNGYNVVGGRLYLDDFYGNINQGKSANQGGVGGLSLLGVPNPTADGFLGKSFHEWYDAAGKMLAGETVPAILSSLSKDAKILRIGTGASVGIALIGLGMDYAAYRKGEISGGKFLLNQTMSAVGFFPPYGTAASAVYFGVDAFYPGGWNGVGNDISNSVSNTWNTFTQGISQYNNIYKWVPHQ